MTLECLGGDTVPGRFRATGADLSRQVYQAWVRAQCGQPTDVVTSAWKT